MENQSNPSNVRKQKRLNLYLNKQAKLNSLGLFENNPYLTFSPQKNHSDLQIEESNQKIIVSKDLQISHEEFNKSKTFYKLLPHIIRNGRLHKQISTLSTYATIISRFFKKNISIEDFVKNFCTIKSFKSYSVCQILIHEKGFSSATSISSIDKENIVTTEISTSVYNTFFSKIKKSKNKTFDQKDIKLDELRVAGSFLAQEVTYNNHTLVFIISRGDFFEYTEPERDIFKQYITLLSPNLVHLTNNYLKRLRSLNLHNIIDSFPFYFSLDINGEKIENSRAYSRDLISKEGFNYTITYEDIEYLKLDPASFHHERLILMGELLNTLKHELSNPLFGINISTSLLLADSTKKDDVINETIREIGNSSSRCQNIIDNFSKLYNDDNLENESSLRKVIEETITLTKSESKFFKPQIIFTNMDDVLITTNTTFLSQIIFNLIINSSQALKLHNSTIKKQIKVIVEKDKKNILIDVIDNGPGVPQEIKDEIFSPFFTTKETGTGLGLAICRNLSRKINAELFLLPSKDGSHFQLALTQGS